MTTFLVNEALVDIGLGTAGITALVGYLVVFFGLVLLMCVIMIVGRVMAPAKKEEKTEAAAPAAAPVQEMPAPVAAPAAGDLAPGSAGELKLHDVDPKTAAMLMAIVADKMGKPINELRFKSIKEVK